MKKKIYMLSSILFLLFALLCTIGCKDNEKPVAKTEGRPAAVTTQAKQNKSKVIHVFVALCDNINQGIVKVPLAIGNGQDPEKNLYWGAAYGMKSYFKKHTDWKLIKTEQRSGIIIERCLFKHKTENVYLIADAYDGAKIKQATINFLKSCAGSFDDFVLNGSDTLYSGGNANLLAFIGHNGLMDFSINEKYNGVNDKKRDAVILACISKKYFSVHVKATGANPILWSNGLMSPEAYTLKAAIDGWIRNETGEQIRARAASACHQYQKCGIKGARNLLATGW